MQRLLIFILCLSFSLSAHGQNNELMGTYKIAFIGQDNESPKYKAIFAGIESGARRLGSEYSIDVEVIQLSPNLNSKEADSQSATLAKTFLENIDGIIISPAPDESLDTLLNLSKAHGKEIVYIERSVPNVAPFLFLNPDEVLAGQLAGRAILKKLPTGGRVAVLSQKDPTQIFKDRLKGVKKVLGYKRIETITYSEPNYKSANLAIRQTMQKDVNHYIKGWIFLEDWALQGMTNFSWVPRSLPIVTIQTSPTSYLAFDSGHIESYVLHPYFEWGTISANSIIKKLFKGTELEEDEISPKPILVDWRDIERYRKYWKAWLE